MTRNEKTILGILADTSRVESTSMPFQNFRSIIWIDLRDNEPHRLLSFRTFYTLYNEGGEIMKGFFGILFDFIMTILTGGLWLIWIVIRYLRANS